MRHDYFSRCLLSRCCVVSPAFGLPPLYVSFPPLLQANGECGEFNVGDSELGGAAARCGLPFGEGALVILTTRRSGGLGQEAFACASARESHRHRGDPRAPGPSSKDVNLQVLFGPRST